jgi:hypothetical protein
MVTRNAAGTRKVACGSGRAGAIDTRLVAAVQQNAGAKVHEAAGLLNAYYLWASVHARACLQRDAKLANEASDQLAGARARLRRFLSGLCHAYSPAA